MDTNKLLKTSGTVLAGLFMKKSIEYSFDYVLYPVVLLAAGYVWGGVILTILATIINYLIIKAYDWSKTDWLLIEALKSARDDETVALEGVMGKLQWILRFGDIPAFFLITLLDDPTTTTLYLRKGSRQYNGFGRRDWKIFFAANVVANLSWVAAWSAVMSTLMVILKALI